MYGNIKKKNDEQERVEIGDYLRRSFGGTLPKGLTWTVKDGRLVVQIIGISANGLVKLIHAMRLYGIEGESVSHAQITGDPLVTKLRAAASQVCFENHPETTPGAVSSLLTLAADTIDRLNQDTERLRIQFAARAALLEKMMDRFGSRDPTVVLERIDAVLTKQAGQQ